MLKNNGFLRPKTTLALLLLTVVCRTAVAGADRPGWKRQDVDWHITGGSRIKAISKKRATKNRIRAVLEASESVAHLNRAMDFRD